MFSGIAHHPLTFSIQELFGKNKNFLPVAWPRLGEAAWVWGAHLIALSERYIQDSHWSSSYITRLSLGGISCLSLVLYGIRVPIIDPFRAWKHSKVQPMRAEYLEDLDQ